MTDALDDFIYQEKYQRALEAHQEQGESDENAAPDETGPPTEAIAQKTGEEAAHQASDREHCA